MEKDAEFIYRRSQKDLQVDSFVAKASLVLKQNDGAAAIEFAIVAPVFLAALIAMFDVGMMLVAQNALDAAASRAGQFGLTGRDSPGLTRGEAIEQAVKDTVKAYSGGIVDPNKLTISVSAYGDLSAVGKPEPLINDANGNGTWDPGDSYFDINGNKQWDADQGTSNSFGLPGQAVRYEVRYDWQPIYHFFGVKDSIRLTGVSPVVNEDFPGS